jgi:hypothetical protein
VVEWHGHPSDSRTARRRDHEGGWGIDWGYLTGLSCEVKNDSTIGVCKSKEGGSLVRALILSDTVPMAALNVENPMEFIRLTGNLDSTFYIDGHAL